MTMTLKYQHLFLALCFVTALVYLVYTSKAAASKYVASSKIAPRQHEMNAPLFELLNRTVNATDGRVLELVREKFLYNPSEQPYNLLEPDQINPSMGQAQVIDVILRGKRNGVYIECGALDGETRSNTLFFERQRGWKGLLIEADPSNFEKLLTKNRKAFSSPACLATSAYPTIVDFQPQNNMGHIVGKFGNPSSFTSRKASLIRVQCFPLLTFLAALNWTTIDYFSLDVEGAEYSILKEIPWHNVNIKTFSIEYIHDIEGKTEIMKLMEQQGYILHSEVKDPQWLANDFIYVRKDVYYDQSWRQ